MKLTYVLAYLSIFILLKLIIKVMFFYYYYFLLKIKNNAVIRNSNKEINNILNTYIIENNLEISILENNKKNYNAFNCLNKKKKIINFNSTNDSNWSFYKLDYMLGRLWFKSWKENNKNDYLFYSFFSHYFIIISAIISNLVIIFEIIFIPLTYIYTNNNFLFFLKIHNIHFLLIIFSFLFFLSSLILSFYSKKKLEKEYDDSINNFIIKNKIDYLNDFIKARNFHRNIYMPIFLIWYPNKINNKKINLGPFSSIF